MPETKSNERTPVKVIGSVFAGREKPGDFGWMIEQPEYADALFLFNDNEAQFMAHQQDPRGWFGCDVGGGNAVIRPYQCKEPPQAAGIPTGANGEGYKDLNAHVKKMIDLAFASIRDLVATGRYKRIMYSANATGGLGTGIFDVDTDVKNYIVYQIKKLDT